MVIYRNCCSQTFTEAGHPILLTCSYAWLFHNLTTFNPYIQEMRSRDITAFPLQNQGTSGGAVSGQVMTEQVMLHIPASITEKAKRLFCLLVIQQMAAIAKEPGKQLTGMAGLGCNTICYSMRCKDLLTTSDVALRALLGVYGPRDD
jgi:hypothetical protein